jgi:hypothetical protein
MFYDIAPREDIYKAYYNLNYDLNTLNNITKAKLESFHNI